MPETKEFARTRLVQTNLTGVFSKARSPGIAAGPSGIASLLDPALLTRLQATDAPGARAFLERILSRQWRPEDQITPMLKPQIGVTHPLTPRVEVDNNSFTSNNWAGSTIKGSFTAAFGIWRVPIVSKSAMPPGTACDWNSSSWVGIDGTYGSNDVLQAGVQQEVSANGAASYTPWYEWFAPKVAGSPNYIYQTNIDNMEIEPGDEVFCGIYYVAQRGEVLFGNTTRGHYFSIVLAPPPGASFSGNSAEWIVEAPNTGEPGTSLPRFSPVVFSTAFASAAANGYGDPATGDTTNIVGFGSILTSVSLKTMALEIDYAPTLPDVFGYAFINKKTGLTEQHNLFLSADGHIHALWFNFTEGWHHEDRTMLLPGVPPAVSDPFGYAFVNETTWLTEQHNLFRSADRHIHALWFNFTEGWHMRTAQCFCRACLRR